MRPACARLERKIASEALHGLGSVDILVNNAGGSRRFTLEATEAQWEEALTLNFTRQRQLTHRLLPQMMERKWVASSASPASPSPRD